MNARIIPVAVLLCVLCGFCSARAQNGGDYKLSWSTIDAGGGTSTAGPYVLTATIGQPDAGAMSGGDYELSGGFWPGGPLCFVEFEDFARFAEHWLEWPCDESNNWCGGADLNHLDGVNWSDLRVLVYEWLCSCPYKWPLK